VNTNKLKQKLGHKKVVTGCILQLPSPHLVEICGLVGFDFVFIDTEHSAIDERDCEEMVRAAEVRDIVPFVRISNNSPEVVLRFLDIGVKGIILAGMNNSQEAELAVRSAKYYPRGTRGLAATRSSDYGLLKPLSEYVRQANQETMVFGIIESKEAVKNIEEIITVDGIDGIFIGTNDLSQSIGFPGEVNHPIVKEFVNEILKIALRNGKPVGVVIRPGEKPDIYIERGIQILLVNAYGLLVGAAKEFIKAVHFG
jgi:4-hydroxy-2-oxoheptanedioate aldolase